MKVVLHPAAARDAEETQGWYAERSLLASRAFVTALSLAIEQVAQHLLLGSPYLGGTRRFALSKFPFSLVFRVDGENVVIVAIAHHRRKPGYWLQRH